MIRLAAGLLALVLGATPAWASGDSVAAALLRAVHPTGPARVDLDNPSLRLPSSGFELEGVTYDARNGRLAAVVTGEDGERVRVTGRLRHLVDLPVLTRMVAPGETIAAADIERVTVESDRLAQAVATDAAELVGKTPRRAVRPGEPVRIADVQVPLVVKRGELVTIVLQTPAFTLTAQGKAMEDGGKGAPIRVSNTKSGKVLDAVVTAPGTVAVTVR